MRLNSLGYVAWEEEKCQPVRERNVDVCGDNSLHTCDITEIGN